MRKILAVSLGWLLMALPLGGIALAQSKEELQILEMFYEKKDLVVTATRCPKPISQVSENVTIITDREIEAMNAHTVAEVLNRVPGVFVNFTQEFGAVSNVSIQGSEDRHVLVLLDGIRWNFLNSGSAETNTIPVGIIERIEIIKGPASSAWGSSLGGVINIITKDVGVTQRPGGTVRVSVGEAASLDYSAQLSGKASNLGYYLYAGRQESDGLRGNRDYDNTRFFSKFELPLAGNTKMGVSLGYSEPDTNLGDFPSGDIRTQSNLETFYVNAFLRTRLSNKIELQLNGYYISQDVALENNLLGLTPLGQSGDLYLSNLYDEETCGGSGKLIMQANNHTLVAGVELDHGELDQTILAGNFLQFFGAPAKTKTTPDIEKWALYVNDTFLIGRWAITPGIRFDDNNVSGSFLSPSLGATYQLQKNTVLRATVSRGFHYPPLSFSQGGGLFLDPNPSLDAEEVWSYQAGFETILGETLWLKTNLFFHDQDKAIKGVAGGGGPPNYNDLLVNGGELDRKGLEIELKTKPIINFTLGASGSYSHIDPANDNGSSERWAGGLLLEYDDHQSIQAQLHGKYTDWDLHPAFQSNNDDVIWDFNFVKKFHYSHPLKTAFFLTAHNLLNGSQYTNGDSKNPKRWVEMGLQFTF